MNQTVDAYEKMMNGLLKDGDWDLYVQVYEFTDRVAHILWRYMDPEHPLYDAAKAPKYQEAMRKAYERMDTHRRRGAWRSCPKDATLIVLSDHGFTSFRRAVNYNRWLIDNGYMALKAGHGGHDAAGPLRRQPPPLQERGLVARRGPTRSASATSTSTSRAGSGTAS